MIAVQFLEGYVGFIDPEAVVAIRHEGTEANQLRVWLMGVRKPLLVRDPEGELISQILAAQQQDKAFEVERGEYTGDEFLSDN